MPRRDCRTHPNRLAATRRGARLVMFENRDLLFSPTPSISKTRRPSRAAYSRAGAKMVAQTTRAQRPSHIARRLRRDPIPLPPKCVNDVNPTLSNLPKMRNDQKSQNSVCKLPNKYRILLASDANRRAIMPLRDAYAAILRQVLTRFLTNPEGRSRVNRGSFTGQSRVKPGSLTGRFRVPSGSLSSTQFRQSQI